MSDRLIPVMLGLLVSSTVAFAANPKSNEYRNSFLDSSQETVNWYSLTVFSPSDFKNTDLSLWPVEFDAHFLYGEYNNFCSGDAKLSSDIRLTFFADGGDITQIPTYMLRMPLDAEIIWRFVNNWSLELGFAPGFYGDINGFSSYCLAIPVRACFYYAFNPNFSFRLGAEIRPRWDMAVMPLIGFAYGSDDYYFEIGVPRIFFSNLRRHRNDTVYYFNAEWENTTYGMKDSPEEGYPESVTFNDIRVGIGSSFNCNDVTQMGFEIGASFAKEAVMESSGSSVTADLDPAFYIRLTIGSKF